MASLSLEGAFMDIAIIGAGSVGTALASSFGRAGHGVTVTSSETGDAEKVASEIDGEAVETNE